MRFLEEPGSAGSEVYAWQLEQELWVMGTVQSVARPPVAHSYRLGPPHRAPHPKRRSRPGPGQKQAARSGCDLTSA